jgi:hypothetical protein
MSSGSSHQPQEIKTDCLTSSLTPDLGFLEDRDVSLLEDDEDASKSETKIIDIIGMNELQKTLIQQKDLTRLLGGESCTLHA